MPDLLREQFPHFRPIVEAFGYRNLEFEGWEADDVIATLATRADEAGDQDVRRLDRPRRVPALLGERLPDDDAARRRRRAASTRPSASRLRYGVRPDQVPDFIGLKGDTSDNIPGVPGIGDKTAGQLIAQYGSLEAVIEHVGRALAGAREERSPSTPTRRGRRRSSRRCGATSTSTATRPSSCSRRPTARSCARCSAASSSAACSQRVDMLDEAVPGRRAGAGRGRRRAVARGRRSSAAAGSGRATPSTRAASPSRPRRASCVAPDARATACVLTQARRRRPRREGAARRTPRDDTLLAAYLIEPGRAEYALDDLERRVRRRARARAGDRRGDRRARPARRGAAAARSTPMLERGCASAAPNGSTARSSCR